MNSLVSTLETKKAQGTLRAMSLVSNLVKLSRQTRQERFYHRNDLPSKPLSLNPDFFNRGSNARGDGQASIARCIVGSNPSLVSPRATFKAVWGQRCFRYLDCFDGGYRSLYGVVVLQNVGIKPSTQKSIEQTVATFKAVYLSSNLDRILKDNQGGCLYEWPDSQKWDFSSMVRALGCGLKDEGSIPSLPSTWQKPAIGPTAVRISAVPIRGREEGEPIPMKHVGSIRTLPAEGKGWNYG